MSFRIGLHRHRTWAYATFRLPTPIKPPVYLAHMSRSMFQLLVSKHVRIPAFDHTFMHTHVSTRELGAGQQDRSDRVLGTAFPVSTRHAAN